MAKYDFGGYATKNNLKCSDGRTIRKDAFTENDGKIVPLVWQHVHKDPNNVIGHALLENREDGVYAYGVFNDTEAGKNTKLLVSHGDITALSIYANELQQQGDSVLHGIIREVSLVLAGANPGALIENLAIQHSDGSEEAVVEEAIVYTEEKLSLSGLEHADKAASGEKEQTMKEVFDTLNEDQKTVVYAMLANAIKDSSAEKDPEDDPKGDPKIKHSNEGGTVVKKNVFDNKETGADQKNVLTHTQFQEIIADAKKCGSFKESFMIHAATYGIENIDLLFPDAQSVTTSPDFLMRQNAWVQGVIDGTHHTPFSRIKSTAADITADEARALGYVKGNLKKEEIISLLQRITTPTTIYKKQKLDRDDITDITDLDVVAWLQAEMRMMLNEELARIVLIGDGRDIESADKINETCIRPIYTDDNMYAYHVELDADTDTVVVDLVDEMLRARKNYKGSGSPTLYTDIDTLTDMLLKKDSTGRRIYPTLADLQSALMVSNIVEVSVMEGLTRTVGTVPNTKNLSLKGIIVNLSDYTVGADKGGAISMFDDFDIDYNQYKYLMETRCSGALTHPASALVIEQIVPVVPAG